jgi:hypothetical protein
MRRALAKINKSLREQTQSDEVSHRSGAGDQDAAAADGSEEDSRTAIAQLNLLLPTGPLLQLERYLSPHLAQSPLRHEIVFVSGFDDQVAHPTAPHPPLT